MEPTGAQRPTQNSDLAISEKHTVQAWDQTMSGEGSGQALKLGSIWFTCRVALCSAGAFKIKIQFFLGGAHYTIIYNHEPPE